MPARTCTARRFILVPPLLSHSTNEKPVTHLRIPLVATYRSRQGECILKRRKRTDCVRSASSKAGSDPAIPRVLSSGFLRQPSRLETSSLERPLGPWLCVPAFRRTCKLRECPPSFDVLKEGRGLPLGMLSLPKASPLREIYRADEKTNEKITGAEALMGLFAVEKPLPQLKSASGRGGNQPFSRRKQQIYKSGTAPLHRRKTRYICSFR